MNPRLQALLPVTAADLTEVSETGNGFDGSGITASVPVMGPAVDAPVFLIISHGFLFQAATALFGASPASPTPDLLLEDFAGELCNMVAGRVAHELCSSGLTCLLGIPRIHDDQIPLPEPGAAVQSGRADWSWKGLPIAVVIHWHST